MEQNNGSDGSKHQNVKPVDLEVTSSSKDQDEHSMAISKENDPLNHDKSVALTSSSSSSPSESDSSGKEENGSRSPIVDPELPPDTGGTTPQWSMMSASPMAGASPPGSAFAFSPETNTVNASPKQSPAIQVMGRPPGYDPNRIPSSVFNTRPTTPGDWSVASNESLFSIQMGNNSFSRDHSVLISKSGELNRPDDWLNYPCFTSDINKSGDLTGMSSGLPTVMETTAENERKSASTTGESVEKEELLETQSAVPIGSRMEEEKTPASEGPHSSSPNSNVPDGKGAISPETPHNSASTPRLSNDSGNSGRSFAFPVLEGGGSMKAEAEKPQPPPSTPPVPEGEAEGEPETKDPVATTPKPGGTRWFNCFSCCPLCR